MEKVEDKQQWGREKVRRRRLSYISMAESEYFFLMRFPFLKFYLIFIFLNKIHQLLQVIFSPVMLYRFKIFIVIFPLTKEYKEYSYKLTKN